MLKRWSGRSVNTVNICVGHQPFPVPGFIDLMISPRPLSALHAAVVADDAAHGPHGSSLSEYSQLLWLYEHFQDVIGGHEFVRIVQYRRFVARRRIGRRTNHDFARFVTPAELPAQHADFSRATAHELFNGTCAFRGGMLGQYAGAHVLRDMLSFARFLLEEDILDSAGVATFLTSPVTIPASSIGVFRASTLAALLGELRRAAAFLHSSAFIARTGYQRRVLGFLLERLQAHLLLQYLRSTTGAKQGHHIMVLDTGVVTVTL